MSEQTPEQSQPEDPKDNPEGEKAETVEQNITSKVTKPTE